jgi:hypothetical protein
MESLYDSLLAAGCLLTPEAREVIARAGVWLDYMGAEVTFVHNIPNGFAEAVRAYRAATEPPKYVVKDCGDYFSAAWRGNERMASFFGTTHRADCEAWVAMKNGGRA